MKTNIVYFLTLFLCLSLHSCNKEETGEGGNDPNENGEEIITDNKSSFKISSPTIDNISTNGATIKGTILGENVKFQDRGICYSTKSTPTVDDMVTSFNADIVNKSISNLYPGTTYYVRLYAMINDVYYYGKENSFTTEGEKVSQFIFNEISETSNLTHSKIELKVKLPNEIGKYGLCYGKKPHPKVTDNFTPEENRETSWVLPKIDCGSEYYVRPYHIEGTEIIYYENSETKIITLNKEQIKHEFEFSIKDSYSLSITIKDLPKATYEVKPLVWRWKDAYYQEHDGKNYDTPSKYIELSDESLTVKFSGKIDFPKTHSMYAEDYNYHLDGFTIKPVDKDNIKTYKISFVDKDL